MVQVCEDFQGLSHSLRHCFLGLHVQAESVLLHAGSFALLFLGHKAKAPC